ncbi:MAG: EamA family transporter [Patescibacteria group bacterium]|jgi:drug/metabolite transporter (DMT)-like permease
MKQKQNKNIYFGALAIMLAAFLWSLDGTFIRPNLYALPAALVVFLEHAMGFILLSPFIFLGWRRIKNLTPKDWTAVLWVSIFGGLLGTLMITKAFFAAFGGETTFATVIILQKLQPIFALFLAAILLKERLSFKFYIWAALAIAAAYVLAFGSHGVSFDIILNNKAAWYAFLAAFSFGSSTVFGKRLINHIDFKSATALRFGVTSILALILILTTRELWQINTIQFFQWQLLILIVFSSGAVALFIYYFGLKRVSASTATIAELFWPFSAIILDYIINKNVLNSVQITASLFLLLAIYFVTKEGRGGIRNFRATVVPGRGIGSRLGFATANLEKKDLDIEHGVYIVRTVFNSKNYRGLLHFGYRETFDSKPSLELYVKDFLGDLPGASVEVETIKKIRNVKKFKSIKDLKEQIKKDLEQLQ